MRQLIRRLKKYLEQDGGNAVKLAGLFGYDTAETIKLWVKRSSVPSYRVKELEAHLKEEGVL